MNEKNKKAYGNMPVKRYIVSDHYHVIADETEDKYVSVGLTSDKPPDKKNQKLHKVYESNGKIARLKNSATIDKKGKYSKKNANFHIDLESEERAKKLASNKKSKNNLK